MRLQRGLEAAERGSPAAPRPQIGQAVRKKPSVLHSASWCVQVADILLFSLFAAPQKVERLQWPCGPSFVARECNDALDSSYLTLFHNPS